MHLNQVMKVCVCGGGVISCLGAREREQHKEEEEEDNITRVVKRI